MKKILVVKIFLFLLVLLATNSFAQNKPQNSAPTAEEYFEQAGKYFNSGDLEKALENFRQAEKLQPKRFEIQYNLGAVLFY